jgi:hypothetical protein
MCTNKLHSQYISVHVRHGDFVNWCGGVPLEDCFANTTVINRRVQEEKDELLQRKGLHVEHVIITSDEQDPAWWDDVEAHGWLQVDHSETVERYGKWYVSLCACVFRSLIASVKGTPSSLMPLFNRTAWALLVPTGQPCPYWLGGAFRTGTMGRYGQ